MINIDKYVIPHNRQHRFNTHAPKYKVECVCLRSVTGDLRDYTPPLNLPLTLCNGNSVLYNYGQPLKEVWKCVQLALYSPVSNPFWAHKGALLNNGKSGEKGQLQAWPRCLRTDFMHRKRRLCARTHVHTFLRVSARVCVRACTRLSALWTCQSVCLMSLYCTSFALQITEEYVRCAHHSASNVLI